jgi:hypothetical protein
VYTVQATAGSGKTQLALALLQGAVQRHERCAYVCFNRALADHMVRLAPPRAQVGTFHEWCMQHQPSAAADAAALDGGLGKVFADAAAQFVASAAQQAPIFDLLIVDESQDFDAAWVGALLTKVKQTGRLYVLGDCDQAVYDREPFEVAQAVSIRSDDNFRSPRLIVATINALQLCPTPVVARSAFEGFLPNFHPYAPQDKGGVKATEQCIKGLLHDGVRLDQIVLLSFVGRERSHLLAQSHLGAWALRRFTGRFDAAGNAVWTQGELLADSLRRFKGQAAPVVVLCEVDFAMDDEGGGEHDAAPPTISPLNKRKLFVGFTRAQFRLECMVSEAAYAAMCAAL